MIFETYLLQRDAGHEEEARGDSGHDSVSDIPELKKDFLIFRSTPAGYVTPASPGDQFIQKFCQVSYFQQKSNKYI